MRKQGKELEFVSRIKRDGTGVIPIEDGEDMSHWDDTNFEMNSLSISNKTWIASEFNSYVVRLKSEK